MTLSVQRCQPTFSSTVQSPFEPTMGGPAFNQCCEDKNEVEKRWCQAKVTRSNMVKARLSQTNSVKFHGIGEMSSQFLAPSLAFSVGSTAFLVDLAVQTSLLSRCADQKTRSTIDHGLCCPCHHEPIQLHLNASSTQPFNGSCHPQRVFSTHSQPSTFPIVLNKSNLKSQRPPSQGGRPLNEAAQNLGGGNPERGVFSGNERGCFLRREGGKRTDANNHQSSSLNPKAESSFHSLDARLVESKLPNITSVLPCREIHNKVIFLTTTMSLTCELSGAALFAASGNNKDNDDEIVVTPSGHVCRKRLLLSKLAETGGRDPFNNSQQISEDQLVTLKLPSASSVVPPRVSSTSVPSLLQTLQSDYDAVMLELFDTRQALDAETGTRREDAQEGKYHEDPDNITIPWHNTTILL